MAIVSATTTPYQSSLTTQTSSAAMSKAIGISSSATVGKTINSTIKVTSSATAKATSSTTASTTCTSNSSANSRVNYSSSATVSKTSSSTSGTKISSSTTASKTSSGTIVVKTPSSTPGSKISSSTTAPNTSSTTSGSKISSSTTASNTSSSIGDVIKSAIIGQTANAITTTAGAATSVTTGQTGNIVGHAVSAAASSVTAQVKKMTQSEIESRLIELGFFNRYGNSHVDSSSTMSDSVSCSFDEARNNFCYLYCRNEDGIVDYRAFEDKLKMVSDTYRKILEKDEDGRDKLDAIFEENVFGNTGDEIKKSFSKAWTFLRLGMGFSDELAAAIMGNWYAESAISETDAENIPGRDNSGCEYRENVKEGWGLMQWTDPDRKKGLLAIADEMNSGVGNINVQLAYFRREIMEGVEEVTTKSDWEHVISQSNLDDYAVTYMKYMEDPANPDKEEGKRKNYARIIYDVIGGVVE